MTADISWLAREAENIHGFFLSVFYVLAGALLMLGILLEYFKLPLGDMPAFPQLVGRLFVAALLLHTFPEFTNLLRDLTTALSERLGDASQFPLVREKLGNKIHEFSLSWIYVKESFTVIVAYSAFVLFHLSIYVADACLIYAWVFLYVLSPVLIACFVLPATSGVTKALYRSLIEVSLWKPVWCVNATLLWSTALSEINKPTSQISFLTVFCYCLVLAGSLLLTPFLVHALASTGIATLTRNIAAVGIGTTAVGAAKAARTVSSTTAVVARPVGGRLYNAALDRGSNVTRKALPRVSSALARMPRINLNGKTPIFQKPEKNI